MLLADAGPEVYVPWEQQSSAFPAFLVRVQSRPEASLRSVRVVLARLVPDRPAFASVVREDIERQLAGVRQTAWQLTGFALAGLALALLGIHGVLAYSVSRRYRELGVRGALGASRAQLVGLVLREAFSLGLVGLVIGLPAAIAATRLIGTMLAGAPSTEPSVYAMVAMGVAAMTSATGLGAAWRAARIDTMAALRSE
jgi:putative ABC transport system permease protein